MVKLSGYETETWKLSAREVEILQDAADHCDVGKNDLFIDFDECVLLIEHCDGDFYMHVFEPGKGRERALSLVEDENDTDDCDNLFEHWATDGKQGGVMELLYKYRKEVLA